MDLTAIVITVSTRAARGEYEDRSGPILADRLRSWGCTVGEVRVVPDGEAVGQALADALTEKPDVILTTGGTGLTPTDHTPEQTRGVLDAEIPQLAAAIARYGVDKGIPSAMLSRGLAGRAGRTLVVNLPGSTGGVKDALAVLEPVLEHAVAQINGSDH